MLEVAILSLNVLFNAVKSPSTHEEDVPGIDGNELLLRVLPATLGWNIDFGPFEQFQQALAAPPRHSHRG